MTPRFNLISNQDYAPGMAHFAEEELKLRCEWVHLRFSGVVAALLFLCAAPLPAQSLDQIHKAALKEGGTLNFYGTLAQINAEKILPVFEKRFAGIRVYQSQSRRCDLR